VRTLSLLCSVFLAICNTASAATPSPGCLQSCEDPDCFTAADTPGQVAQCRAGVQECRKDCSTALVQHILDIRRFSTSTLTNADADKILADMGTILQAANGGGDISCNVGFLRDSGVTTFTDGTGKVSNAADFNNFMGQRRRIWVLNSIRWCGSLKPNFIGCTRRGASSVVVRYIPTQEGILWAHEFGHTQGLPDRNTANFVMNGINFPGNLNIDAAECDAYRYIPLRNDLFPAVAGSQTPLERTAIEVFVTQAYIHGVPFDRASRYDFSVFPTLLELLNDPHYEAYWSNIVTTLGMIGDERAVDLLIAFIQRGDQDVLSPEKYTAKTSAIMSLGYIINKTGNQKALEYLRTGINPETWSNRRITGIASFQKNMVERNRDFSEASILGLALSGHPEAEQALKSSQQIPETDIDRNFQEQKNNLITEALKEHRRISQMGLEEYYKTPSP
jgi:hypothetical protein